MTIGVMLPFTGTLEGRGALSQRVLELAFDEINRAGGVLGGRIELDIVDTQSTPAGAAMAAQELIDRGRSILIGPGSGTEVNAVSAVTVPAGALLFAPVALPETTVDGHDLVFGLLGSLTKQNTVVAQYWANRGVDSAVLLLLGAPGFNPQQFVGPWTAVGIDARVETYPVLGPNELQNYDFTPHITAALENDPELVVVATNSFDGAKLLNQMQIELDKRPSYAPTLSVDPAMLSPEFMSNVPAELMLQLEGVKPVVDATTAEYQHYDALYQETYQEPLPPGFWSYWYDPPYLVAAAIAAAGSTGATEVAAQLRGVSRGGERFSAASFAEMRAAIAAGGDVDYVGATHDVDLDDVFGSSLTLTLRAWRIIQGAAGPAVEEHGDVLRF